ncbi:hypothetical protein ACU686_44330 [Yinghuangia aomiensis]
MALVMLAIGGLAWWAYDRLNGNIKTDDFAAKLGDQGRPPTKALNILLVGTDSRAGANAEYGDSELGNSQRSDTTVLLHIPEGRKAALGVNSRATSWWTCPPAPRPMAPSPVPISACSTARWRPAAPPAPSRPSNS